MRQTSVRLRPDSLAVARRARSGPDSLRVSLAALYAPGGPRRIAVPKSRWPAVFRALACVPNPFADGPPALAKAGIGEAAVLLTDRDLLCWAEAQVGRASSDAGVVTVACPTYPASWLEKLRHDAPPAFWMLSGLPGRGLDVEAVWVPTDSGSAGTETERAGRSIQDAIARAGWRLAVFEASLEHSKLSGPSAGGMVHLLPFGKDPQPNAHLEAELGLGASDIVWLGGPQTDLRAAFLALGSLALVGPGAVDRHWQHALMAHRRARRGPIAVWNGPCCGFRQSLLRLGAIPFRDSKDLDLVLSETRRASCAYP